ncbi:MAG: DUF5693 family protein [Candidatus Margulisiibacteriota bacterium]|jgi:hypothetical protein
MLKRIIWGILKISLIISVLVGCYFGLERHLAEQATRSVRVVIDLNDLKKAAAYEKQPLTAVLKEVRKIGFSELGVFEETLPDANALGEIYYAKGGSIRKLAAFSPVFSAKIKEIKPDRTYIFAPFQESRKRIVAQLTWALGAKSIRFLGRDVIEVDEAEEELRALGLGISEAQKNYLERLGFRLVPRVWNDPRYHLGNIEAKLSGLKDYRTIIFDGEELLGFPEAVPSLAEALKKFRLNYGFVEIVKQDGDYQLKNLMANEVVRVHSVPKDELKKLEKPEVLDRYLRAARERQVKLLYVRPFLPPQIDAVPVEYNLRFFGELKNKLAAAHFTIGEGKEPPPLQITGWQIIALGWGVLVGTLLLLNAFVALPLWGLVIALLAGVNALLFLAAKLTILQKLLAFTAAVVFPSLAVISSANRLNRQGGFPLFQAFYFVLRIVAITALGIIFIVGLLADSRYMSGALVFPAVKAGLVLPIMIVAAYFLLKEGELNLIDRVKAILRTKVSVANALIGLILLAALGLFLARSGNFTIPVPGIEKAFRNWLEVLLFVRPRTKEFLVGYPFLFLAAVYYLKASDRSWLWVVMAIGAIAPVSALNTFSHIHTPLTISIVRLINGLVLGLIFGIIIAIVAGRWFSKEGEK